jgi:hypothetical protein
MKLTLQQLLVVVLLPPPVLQDLHPQVLQGVGRPAVGLDGHRRFYSGDYG